MLKMLNYYFKNFLSFYFFIWLYFYILFYLFVLFYYFLIKLDFYQIFRIIPLLIKHHFAYINDVWKNFFYFNHYFKIAKNIFFCTIKMSFQKSGLFLLTWIVLCYNATAWEASIDLQKPFSGNLNKSYVSFFFIIKYLVFKKTCYYFIIFLYISQLIWNCTYNGIKIQFNVSSLLTTHESVHKFKKADVSINSLNILNIYLI